MTSKMVPNGGILCPRDTIVVTWEFTDAGVWMLHGKRCLASYAYYNATGVVAEGADIVLPIVFPSGRIAIKEADGNHPRLWMGEAEERDIPRWKQPDTEVSS